MRLDKMFNGFIGYNGIIAIHADWPIYPRDTGWQIALLAIGNFPSNTKFLLQDDIDTCKLFTVKASDSFKKKNLKNMVYLSVWDADLIELLDLGYINGVKKLNEYEKSLEKFEEMKNVFGLDDEGNINSYMMENDKLIKAPVQKPMLEDYYNIEDFDIIEEDRNQVGIENEISLTKLGIEALEEFTLKIEFSKEINELIQPLLLINRFDTAIREASLFLESEMKKNYGLNLHGALLIDAHIAKLVSKNDDIYASYLKTYHEEMKILFRYTRNPFMHNFHSLTESQCRKIINRIDLIYRDFKQFISILN